MKQLTLCWEWPITWILRACSNSNNNNNKNLLNPLDLESRKDLSSETASPTQFYPHVPHLFLNPTTKILYFSEINVLTYNILLLSCANIYMQKSPVENTSAPFTQSVKIFYLQHFLTINRLSKVLSFILMGKWFLWAQIAWSQVVSTWLICFQYKLSRQCGYLLIHCFICP